MEATTCRLPPAPVTHHRLYLPSPLNPLSALPHPHDLALQSLRRSELLVDMGEDSEFHHNAGTRRELCVTPVVVACFHGISWVMRESSTPAAPTLAHLPPYKSSSSSLSSSSRSSTSLGPSPCHPRTASVGQEPPFVWWRSAMGRWNGDRHFLNARDYLSIVLRSVIRPNPRRSLHRRPPYPSCTRR